MCVCVCYKQSFSRLSPNRISVCRFVPIASHFSHFALFSSFISCFLSSHCLFSSPLSSSLFTLFFPSPLSSPATPFHIVVSFHLLSPCLPSSFLSSGLFPIPLLLMFSFAPLLSFTFLSFYHFTSSFISNLPLLSLPPHSHCFPSLFSSSFVSSCHLPFCLPCLHPLFLLFCRFSLSSPLLSSLPPNISILSHFHCAFLLTSSILLPASFMPNSIDDILLSLFFAPPSPFSPPSLTLSPFQVTGNEILAYWLISTCPQFDLCMCLSLFLTHTPIHPLTHTHAYTFLNFPRTYASLSGDSRERRLTHSRVCAHTFAKQQPFYFDTFPPTFANTWFTSFHYIVSPHKSLSIGSS